MGVKSVSVPDSISIPAGMTSIDGALTVIGGDATSISILGVFTITIKAKTGSNPQNVTFTLGLKQGIGRPGQDSQPISVTIGGQPVTSQNVAITY